MRLLIALLIIPVIEIAVFIEVGGVIGLWPTLALVVLTTVFGAWLVRTQGMLALSEIRRSFSQQSDPTEPLAHSAMILIAGVLLITPGFFTDALGFALLIPPIRRAAFASISKRVRVQSFTASAQAQRPAHARQPTCIEGDYVDVSPKDDKKRGPSGWTRD